MIQGTVDTFTAQQNVVRTNTLFMMIATHGQFFSKF